MANYFTITLDTTAPASPTRVIEGGAAYIAAQLVNIAISTGDSVTTGYQMKIWGDVDGSNDSNVQTAEGTSSWITYATSKQIKLSTGDALKTLYLKIRDDVYNISAQTSDTITLDTTLPVVTIQSGPDIVKISKQTGKNLVTFAWQSDSAFTDYMVKVVPASGSSNSAGTAILTTNGSTYVAASGSFPATTNITTTVRGEDLEVAGSGDGDKIVKIFVKESSGNWSV